MLTTVAVSALAGCDGDEDHRPSPGAAERYDVVIAICKTKLPSTQGFCDRISSSSDDVVYANVIFGRAPGHRVAVHTRVVDGGNAVDEPGGNVVPENRSWLDAVELDRARTCDETSCKVRVSAIVDGDEVAREDFTFESD
jgi:hypothetical protein